MPVVVTGASGWLGQAAVEMLEDVYGDEVPAKVTAFSSFGKPIILRSGRVIRARPFAELEHLKSSASLVFHCAFLTREHVQSQTLEDYITANRKIQRIMRAFIQRNGALGVFIPSSGAVYGPGRILSVDIAANPYGVLKHEDELTFQDQASRMGFPISILRVFNLSGAFINKFSSYALASIIQDIERGGPIRLRADRPVWRSYADVGDVLNVAVTQLCNNKSILPCDTAGDETVEVGALASRIAERLGAANREIVRPTLSAAPGDFYLGDRHRFFEYADAAGVNLKNLDEQIALTAKYMNSLAAV